MTGGNDYETDFAWQARFAAHASEIVRNYVRDQLFAELDDTTPEDDWKRNTDGFVRFHVRLPKNNARLSRRVRRVGYRTNYQYEQTIRKDRPSGAEAEFPKLMNGYGDIELYGFGPDDGLGEDGPQLRFVQWFLGDLNILRTYLAEGCYLPKPKKNKDRSSRLTWVDLRDLPAEYVLASENLPSLEHGKDWFACRNGNWFCSDLDHSAKRWTGDAAARLCADSEKHANLRNGFCGGGYAVALDDTYRPGPGRWRQCLACGFRWRAGWDAQSAAQALRRERADRVLAGVYPATEPEREPGEWRDQVGRCVVCHTAMTIVEPGQTTHPTCHPDPHASAPDDHGSGGG